MAKNRIFQNILKKMSWIRITIFLSLVISVWGGIHFYIYRRTLYFFNIKAPETTYLAILFFILFSSFPLTRVLLKLFLLPISFILYFASTLWIGIIFYLFFFALIGEIFWFVLAKVSGVPRHSVGVIILILTTLTIILGFLEANNIAVRSLDINISKDKTRTIKIAMLSDLHLGLNINYLRLRKIIPEINKFSPDLIVIIGDIVDEEADRISQYIKIFSKLKTRYGLFAVTGNHEYYAGKETFLNFFKKAKIRLLRNEIVNLNGIEIAGVDDEAFLAGKWEENLKKVLSGHKEELPLILLKHRPTGFDIARSFGVDLMLSGHTHKAQLFPFHLITSRVYRYFYGYHREGKMQIYITSGLGTWGPPIRVIARPEVVLITIR